MTRTRELYPSQSDIDDSQVKELANELRRDFPNLSRQQRYSMARIQLLPGYNNNAVFVGIDAKGRPVYEGEQIGGGRRRNAHTREADPTDVTEPVDETQRRFLKPSEFLRQLHGHGIYKASMLDRCRFDTSSVTTYTEDETAEAINARGLGGELERHGEKVIWGWRVAEDLCYAFTGQTSDKHGRGFIFRACIDALEEAGH